MAPCMEVMRAVHCRGRRLLNGSTALPRPGLRNRRKPALTRDLPEPVGPVRLPPSAASRRRGGSPCIGCDLTSGDIGLVGTITLPRTAQGRCSAHAHAYRISSSPISDRRASSGQSPLVLPSPTRMPRRLVLACDDRRPDSEMGGCWIAGVPATTCETGETSRSFTAGHCPRPCWRIAGVLSAIRGRACRRRDTFRTKRRGMQGHAQSGPWSPSGHTNMGAVSGQAPTCCIRTSLWESRRHQQPERRSCTQRRPKPIRARANHRLRADGRCALPRSSPALSGNGGIDHHPIHTTPRRTQPSTPHSACLGSFGRVQPMPPVARIDAHNTANAWAMTGAGCEVLERQGVQGG